MPRPIRLFFGCQRQRGGTGDNPSAREFYNNSQALRVVDSFCRGPVRGNCREPGKRLKENMPPIDNTPLAKRRKNH